MRSRSRHVLSLALTLWAASALFSLAARAEETISSEELARVKATEAARVQVIEKVYGSVVAIYGNNRQGGGSGVLFSPEGFALTNFHVVAGAGQEGWAGLADGKLYRWKLYGLDPGGDVAIIRLEGQSHFPVAQLGDSRTVRVGDWAMAMGNPFVLAEDQRPTVTLGIVSAIHRFQPGQSKTALVYGNCIQVDSSINPGNSGGPLFNLQGQVLGINGRGSFEERGRVNVGVGYAISIEQIKNFLPDLLATKVAEHGTLDAVFSDRTGGVICSKLNLNSKAAALGLALGDKLISFAGEPIKDANQYLNLVTTFPAKWPVEVVFQHELESKPRSIWIRLETLAYAPPAQHTTSPGIPAVPGSKTPDQKKSEEKKSDEKKPDDKKPDEKKAEAKKPDEKKTDDAKPDDKKPDEKKADAEKPQPDEAKPVDEKPAEEKKSGDAKPEPAKPAQPPVKIARPVAAAPLKPGKIRDDKLNHERAVQVLHQWMQTASHEPDAFARLKGLHWMQQRAADVQVVTAVADGRFVVDRPTGEAEGATVGVFGWDGKEFWLRDKADAPLAALKGGAAQEKLDDQVLVTALAALYSAKPEAAFAKLALDGGDMSQGRRTYRLSGDLKSGQTIYLWFSLLGANGDFRIELVKLATDTDDQLAYAFQDFQTVAGVDFPRTVSVVQGLAEQAQSKWTLSKVDLADIDADDHLRRPADESPQK